MAGPNKTSADAVTSGGVFSGFTPDDFLAYEPKKWASNAFTRPRREVKDKLLALARAVAGEVGEELADLELHGSDEAPTLKNNKRVQAQSAFFLRDAEARHALKALVHKTDLGAASLFDIALEHEHACLYLRLHLAGLAIGVEIAGRARADRDNVVEKLRQGWARDKLVELTRALPGGTQIGPPGGGVDALALVPPAIESWLPKLRGSDATFAVETLIPKEEGALASDAVIGTVVELVSAYLPIYRFLACSRDNAHTQIKETIKKQVVEQKKQRALAMQPGDRVTILSGLFAGRSGYLAELDAKGRAKVMVGPISVNVEAKDLKGS